MTVREEDVSSEHFDWLVEARSRNQRGTAALYKIIERHAAFLVKHVFLQSVTQDLAAIAFSLWRAVFLSDLTGDPGRQLIDVRHFLRSLIAYNAVLYQTDFTSREWAFRYYLQNAVFCLRHIDLPNSTLGHLKSVEQTGGSAKDEWLEAQNALDVAIFDFERAVVEHDAR